MKGGHELTVQTDLAHKSQKFDRNSAQDDDLYRWSGLRSAYLGEANVDRAGYFANYSWGPVGRASVGWRLVVGPLVQRIHIYPWRRNLLQSFWLGLSTPHSTSTVRRALAMGTRATIIASAPTTTIGALALTIRAIPAMRLGCTICQTQQLIISAPLRQRASAVWASTPAHAAS